MVEKPEFLEKHKYSILFGTYALVTCGLIFKIARQPYIRSTKADQIETVFKGSTSTVVLVGIGISGRINKTRSSRS